MDTKFTMVLDKELAEKMSYIGRYYGRSRIREIEWSCKEYIKKFEQEHGKITAEDLEGR